MEKQKGHQWIQKNIKDSGGYGETKRTTVDTEKQRTAVGMEKQKGHQWIQKNIKDSGGYGETKRTG